MSTVVEALSELLNLPETVEKFVLSSAARRYDGDNPGRVAAASAFPLDVIDSPEEYVCHMDVPGLSKSDIQVTIEDGNTLVIKSNGKRKREDGEEGCQYIRLERRPVQKVTRKFRLSENADVSAITAKCENGVLTVVVKKLPPPPKPKTVKVAIS